ncbi:hypothetical protein FB451DRAFT_1241658 [Mycena latifolia]|nr:hypothetical protein FB451DRAFT_1241658 [Mycena latifolia]
MPFHGVVLLLAGYQADEARTLRTYRTIVDSRVSLFPSFFRFSIFAVHSGLPRWTAQSLTFARSPLLLARQLRFRR